jgi:xanthine dehydrogenase accessory factor
MEDPALAAALRADCFYVGALGSKTTHAKRLERLRAAGFCEADLAKIHAPIGLAIGAANGPEIAIAILAEIIAVLRQKKPRFEAGQTG